MEVATASTANATRVKVQDEAESEAPTRIQLPKPLSLTNGVLKRLHPPHHHLNGQPVVVTYKECLKNHAATMGGHAVDGCGEFMPSPTANPADPTSLKCAACGCHRNFHRREPDEPLLASPTAAQHVIEYQSHHRHHPPPPLPAPPRSPNSASPPPISSSYYPSAPHMLLALSSGGLSGLPHENNPSITPTSGATTGSGGNLNPSSRKRFRTKFTQNQKDKMYEFAEKLCWKMQKRDEDLINEFCNEVGVDKGVFKVWMHNNKNTLGKKDLHNSNGISSSINLDNTPNHYNSTEQNLTHHHHQNDSVSAHPVATNGSSSSS